MKFLELYQKLKDECTPISFGQKIMFDVKHNEEIINELNEFCYNIKNSKKFLLSQKIWHVINNDHNNHICPICQKELKFIKLSKGYQEYCSVQCKAKFTSKNYWNTISELDKKNILKTRTETLKKTLKDKYPNSNYINCSQTPEFRKKYEMTCLEKYGNKSHMFSEIIKEKIKISNLQKYGVTCTLHFPETHEKTKKQI